MRVAEGQRIISADRDTTFEYGCNPDIWRETSAGRKLGVNPRDDESLRLGSVLDISVDLSDVKFPFPINKALNRIKGKGPLEFESEITEMEPGERIIVNGGIAIAGIQLTINLNDTMQRHSSFRDMKQTLAAYTLDINLLGSLAPFDRALGALKTSIEPEAGMFVERLGHNIENTIFLTRQETSA